MQGYALPYRGRTCIAYCKYSDKDTKPNHDALVMMCLPIVPPNRAEPCDGLANAGVDRARRNNIGGRIQVSLAALRSIDWLGGDPL